MTVDFNHTIVWAHNGAASAAFVSEILGLGRPAKWGPFDIVATDNGVNIDFMEKEGEITTQHYAFLVGDSDFDRIFDRIRQKELPYWADPARTREGGNQPSRRWARRLLRGPERPCAGDHHPSLRQRRLEPVGAS